MEQPELERLIVETHSTVATLVERSISIEKNVIGVQARQDVTNGNVADIRKDQYRQDGERAAFKWMFTAMMAMMGVGVGVAGVVLAIVAK